MNEVVAVPQAANPLACSPDLAANTDVIEKSDVIVATSS